MIVRPAPSDARSRPAGFLLLPHAVMPNLPLGQGSRGHRRLHCPDETVIGMAPRGPPAMREDRLMLSCRNEAPRGGDEISNLKSMTSWECDAAVLRMVELDRSTGFRSR